MEEKKNTSIDYAALRKALVAGGLVILGGVAYYVTAWRIKRDFIQPNLNVCKENAEKFLDSWAEEK